MGTPEEDARKRAKYGDVISQVPDEPVQATPVAVAEPVSERDKIRSKYGNVISQDTQVPAVPTIQPTVIPSQVTPPQVTSPQITRDASGRKSQAELIEEYEARRAPAPGSVFEGREPLPFGERPPDRDPLGIITGAPQAFQRNVLEPISALATTVETPFSPLQNPAVSLARYLMDRIPGVDAGLPGFSNEFALNPNQIPGQPDWRERYRENIPAGTRFVSEAGLDPLNLIPGIGLTRLPSRFTHGELLITLTLVGPATLSLRHHRLFRDKSHYVMLYSRCKMLHSNWLYLPVLNLQRFL
jgi:hypothetical protein